MAYLKNINKRSTLAYRFSVDTKDDKDLIHLKAQVKEHNKNAKKYLHITPKRVALMARGKRTINAYQTHHKDAIYFDVYVH